MGRVILINAPVDGEFKTWRALVPVVTQTAKKSEFVLEFKRRNRW